METLRVFILLIVATVSIDAGSYDVVEPTSWWQTNIVYEIWPRSFKDSDGDGIGDLNGITSKLDHVADMGADTIWLTPFYTSPMLESGYDVSDYYTINPTYGTMEDFEALVVRAHELDVKVLIDFVPNHVSDQHYWYLQAVQGVEPYVDYFIWNDGILVNGTRQPPNNWLNMFNSGSTWMWVEERNAYVYHQFNEHQIDLNFNNPVVIQEMKNVMTFWLGKGIDGFRIDAVPFLVEDPELRDEPLSGLDVEETNYFYMDHPYTKDLQESYDVLAQLNAHVHEYSETMNDGITRGIFTEGYSNVSYVMKWFEYGVDVPFNFFFISNGEIRNPAVLDTAADVVSIIDTWMENLPSDQSANWVLGNHDNSRIASKFGTGRVDALNLLILLLPGTASIYNGDELGMEDTFLTWEETKDVRACSLDKDTYTLYSRDPVRTPYQWDNTTSAGFSTNSTTEIKVNENYVTLNLAAQKEADVSHYKNIQAAIKLRKTSIVSEGNLNIETIDDEVIALTREIDGEQPIVLVINWNDTDEVTVSLDIFENVPAKAQVLIADINSGIKVGDEVDTTSIVLPANAAVVLRGIDE